MQIICNAVVKLKAETLFKPDILQHISNEIMVVFRCPYFVLCSCYVITAIFFFQNLCRCLQFLSNNALLVNCTLLYIMFFKQLRLLLWKNFTLRKRHWVSRQVIFC